jgi:hypothetical protein
MGNFIQPKIYSCLYSSIPPLLNGKLEGEGWEKAPWTEDFVDIEGDKRPNPRFRTRVKMLWDEKFFYVGAEMDEPHVNAALTEKNSFLFHENDFEVFIDPDSDNHNYYEFEINALGTIWELTLKKPYRAGGPALNGTNLKGLKSSVHIDGTINDPSDTDRGWSVTIAFPWSGLKEYSGNMECPPVNGDQWRVNFSRVEWIYDILHGAYHKIPKEMRPEDNWVWSPQGAVDMHRPSQWGVVEFCTEEPVLLKASPVFTVQQKLMVLYEEQFKRIANKKKPTKDPKELNLPYPIDNITIELLNEGWRAEMKLPIEKGTLICSIQDDQHFSWRIKED